MKWKKSVTVIREEGNIILCLGKKQCPVSETDTYIVEAMIKGVHEEEKLKELIMERDNSNDTVAGLTLAKFILDYQIYLEKDDDYYEITM